MSSEKADLIIHPVRLRIVQVLANRRLTTQEIADALPAVPKSSIYRHMQVLLAAGMVEVAATRPVKGIQERIYQLAQSPHLSAEDIAGLTQDDHLRYFTSYIATLLQGFAEYLEGSPGLDFAADRTGYTEVTFYATNDEFDEFQKTLNQVLLSLLQNDPGDGRLRRKLATITHPLFSKGDDHE